MVACRLGCVIRSSLLILLARTESVTSQQMRIQKVKSDWKAYSQGWGNWATICRLVPLQLLFAVSSLFFRELQEIGQDQFSIWMSAIIEFGVELDPIDITSLTSHCFDGRDWRSR